VNLNSILLQVFSLASVSLVIVNTTSLIFIKSLIKASGQSFEQWNPGMEGTVVEDLNSGHTSEELGKCGKHTRTHISATLWFIYFISERNIQFCFHWEEFKYSRLLYWQIYGSKEIATEEKSVDAQDGECSAVLWMLDSFPHNTAQLPLQTWHLFH
jgi:hypothetical protein